MVKRDKREMKRRGRKILKGERDASHRVSS